ncbi:MAG: hypothetical protein CME71_00495 [Halobacteriovorax sp.]|nr:hypothetical protein [Halobacteriovorax sp.]|tara:strand:- start:1086 stop:1265 length:180 start_codon:yes stop_codon:yes gene_type:complete
MFGILKKDPKKKLQVEYEKLMKQAVEAQRNGNIELYAELTFKSEELLKRIDTLDSATKS